MIQKNKNHSLSNGKYVIWFASVLIFIGISRHLPLDYPELFNFSPVIAIFLFSAAYIKGRFSWIVPTIGVILSDLLLSAFYGHKLVEPFMFVAWFSYALIFLLGKWMGTKGNIYKIGICGLISAFLFHIITCSFSWWINPAYVKTISGLAQAIFLGEPGFPPSYLFLKNTVLGTLFYSSLFAYLAKTLSLQTHANLPIRVHAN